jgi:hypothetical protein
VPRACTSGVGGGSGNPIPPARLGEFAFAGGDRALQTLLASELQWCVTTQSTDAAIDASIARFGVDVPAALDGLFVRRGAEILQSAELLASRACRADMALWNANWKEAYMTCGKQRAQISEELAIVDKLLLARKARKHKGSARRGRETKATRCVAVVDPALSSFFGLVPVAAAVPAVALITTGCLHAFDFYLKTNDPHTLTQVSLLSLLLVAMIGHSSAIRHLVSKGNNRWK